MSITPAMNESERDKHSIAFSYVLSGKTDMPPHAKKSVGMIVLHDEKRKNISAEDALKKYTSVHCNAIIFVHSDGSTAHPHLQAIFPKVHFFSLHSKEESSKVSVGSLLNLLFDEMRTDIVFVSWTDIIPHGISTSMIARNFDEGFLCVSPILEDEKGKIIPTGCRPRIATKNMKILPNKKTPLFPYTFFPYRYIGVYNRKEVLRLRGFDTDIHDSFWQLCDFALRVYSAGHCVRVYPHYRVRMQFPEIVQQQKKNEMYEVLCIKYGFLARKWYVWKYILRTMFRKIIFRVRLSEKFMVLQRARRFSKDRKGKTLRIIQKKINYFFGAVR